MNVQHTSSSGKAKKHRGWTTPDQAAFLSANITAYANAQASKTRSDFWGPLFEDFFTQWPVQEDPTQESGALEKAKVVSS